MTSASAALLTRLQTLLAPGGPGTLALSAEPVVLAPDEWYEEARLVYADAERGGPGGPYVEALNQWGCLEAAVPRGTVVLAFAEGPDGLAWRRCDKSWNEQFGFTVAHDDGRGLINAYQGRVRRYESRWIRRVARPAVVAALAAGAQDAAGSTRVTTGAVVPLFRAHGAVTTTLAVLFLSKRDTKFRRVGLWGLRPPLLAGLPAGVAELLTRGRVGVLSAADLGG